MPSLRKVWQNYCEGNISIETLLGALVETVEPEAYVCGKCHWYGLSRGCLYAWPEGGKHEAPASDDACGWFRRKEPRHTELAEAQAEIDRLRKNRDAVYIALVASEKELASYTASVNADAETGRLVRGMSPTTSLRTMSTPEEGKSAWVSFRWSATGWKRASTISIDPAEGPAHDTGGGR